MSVESPITPENPRTGISFWHDENRIFLAYADLAEIYHLLVLQPSNLVTLSHELWRIGKEEIIFTILRDNKDLVLNTTFDEKGELITALTSLELKNETSDNCLKFTQELLCLTERAMTGKDFNSILEPDKQTELDLKARSLVSIADRDKNIYLGNSSYKN